MYEFFYIFGVICAFAVMIAFVGIASWAVSGRAIKQYEAKRKAAKIVDGTNWLVYDSKAHIKQTGRELREITRGRRKAN